MNEIRSDAAIIAALGRQMTRAVQKQSVAASNLANLDTPGYRTKEVEFDDALNAELGASQMSATDPRHFGAGGNGTDRGRTADAADLASKVDGNNVSLDRELLSLSRAAGDFSAAQTVLAAKFRLVRYAINDGR
ncbi:MAG: flagellar basal body rod protein FlgB [Vicinamibacterales bacterium]